MADLGNKDKTPPPADKDKPPPPLPDKDKPPPPPPPPPQGNKLRLALDSFSGYCIFRSDEFKKKLADQGVDFECVDDNADYAARMKTVAERRYAPGRLHHRRPHQQHAAAGRRPAGHDHHGDRRDARAPTP